jgi:hypothetical protein
MKLVKLSDLMSVNKPSTYRPLVFSIVEDDGENVTIEVSEEDYVADLAVGIDGEETLKPGRHRMKRGGFLARHPELKLQEKNEPEKKPLLQAARCRGWRCIPNP